MLFNLLKKKSNEKQLNREELKVVKDKDIIKIKQTEKLWLRFEFDNVLSMSKDGRLPFYLKKNIRETLERSPFNNDSLFYKYKLCNVGGNLEILIYIVQNQEISIFGKVLDFDYINCLAQEMREVSLKNIGTER